MSVAKSGSHVIPLKGVLIAAVAAVLAGPALADHIQQCNGRKPSPVDDHTALVCSATWQFTATCSGGDMWDKWKLTGQTNPPKPFIKPWLHYPVTVIGYELVKLQGAPASWFMIGSMIQGDAMLWLAPGETHAKEIWPTGFGQPFPSIEDTDPDELHDILDLHGWCPKGETATVMMTIYYTPPWNAQTVEAGKPN
jgi:hypothetical protein